MERLFWHTKDEWAMVSANAVAAASPEMVADVLRMALEDIAALWECAPQMQVTTRSTTPPIEFRKSSERRGKVPGCTYCDQQTTLYFPSHDASPRCESGKHNHCSCNVCF